MSQKKFRSRWQLDGNARMTPALAREMLSAFAASELSVAAFSRLHQISKQRVCYWRQRLGEIDAAEEKRLPSSEARQPSFAPVIAKSSVHSEALRPSRSPMQTLEATLPGGSRVVVHGQWDSASARTWLAAIAGGQC